MALSQISHGQRHGAAEAVDAGPGLIQMPAAMLEACRSANLLMGGPKLTRLGITSALREEGRTSVALAFAAVQRQDFGRSVILVDLDLENPTLAQLHDLDPWPGMAEVIRGEARLDQVMQPVVDGVHLIARGVITDGTARTVSDMVKSTFLAEAGRHADILIADLPPLMGSGPGLTAAGAFEELLLVVRAGVTPVARVKEVAADLPVTPKVLLNGSYSSLPRWIRRLLGT